MSASPRVSGAIVLSIAAACFAPVVPAQAPAGAAVPRPDDAGVPVPARTYVSPFARYRPMSDRAGGTWKALNEEVAKIGGWKVYAREAGEANAPTAVSPGAAGPRPDVPPGRR